MARKTFTTTTAVITMSVFMLMGLEAEGQSWGCWRYWALGGPEPGLILTTNGEVGIVRSARWTYDKRYAHEIEWWPHSLDPVVDPPVDTHYSMSQGENKVLLWRWLPNGMTLEQALRMDLQQRYWGDSGFLYYEFKIWPEGDVYGDGLFKVNGIYTVIQVRVARDAEIDQTKIKNILRDVPLEYGIHWETSFVCEKDGSVKGHPLSELIRGSIRD